MALENSEQKFKVIFENANDGITINEPGGRFLEVNHITCEKLGYSREELLQKKSKDMISSESSKLFIEHMKELYQYGHTVTGSEVACKNGTCSPVELSMSFIEYRGKPAILSIVRDITERKKAEQMLKYERDCAQNYLDIAGTIIVALNAEQKVILINKKGSELLGFPKEDILGKNWFDAFIPEKYGQATKKSYAQLMSGNVEPVKNFENFIITKSGEKRIIKWYNSILKDEEGRITGTLSSGEDITERKKVEEEMKVRSAAMASSLTAIIIANPEGYITYVNSAFLKLWGYSSEEEVLGRSVRNLGFSEVKATGVINTLFSRGSWAGEFVCRRKDSTEFHVHLSASLVVDEAGKTICIMGSFLDISGHKEAEKMMIEARMRAEDANRAKSNFLASMSHELRTPLNSIIGFADVLRERTFGPLNDRQAKYLNNISISGKHLLKLIDDILDLSRVETGKMELNPKEFSVPKMFEEIKVTLAPLALKRNIKMVWKTEGELKSIRADRTKFKQILYNLIDNAIKFTPENGLIKIDTGVSKENISISVTDSGPGISIADQKKLFEPFTQLGKFESREQPGTGLGLVIVKKYVEMHGGTVRVESRIGAGSKFSFTIPLIPE
ncbi:PAS domain S-box protein [Methanosarcina sp. 1.H.A.2.2]|uniref:sensor histidine kinase n=1 Tax=Methanosarcina sp. 1.H.A.2.2 TaxID=1483601 RepID=UPI0021011B6B|nr:PAS domain S-box protein [Methanosarcina sp. 1.H.A.2.2]